jgi:hypothetical protein
MSNNSTKERKPGFVTSSEIYKKIELKNKKKLEEINSKLDAENDIQKERRATKKEKKHMQFLNLLTRYTSCISYIEDYLKTTPNKLEKKYNFISVVNELALVDNINKVDFLRTKLFEILLTLSFTNRVAVMFNEDEESKTLRDLWYHNRNYTRKNIADWAISYSESQNLEEDELISQELKLVKEKDSKS